MAETIEIQATDGSGAFAAHVVRPKGTAIAPCGAVMMIQEIFGVNAAMRSACDWVADMGFIAVAPDLFWRIEPGVDLAEGSDADWNRAVALMNAFDQAKGVEDLGATLVAARAIAGSNGRAGTMGFCLGGRLATLMALHSDADCNVSYYGVGLEFVLRGEVRIANPLLLHIAAKDRFVPPRSQAKILAALQDHPQASAHTYPGVDHAFARIGGHSWDGLAATVANGRTAELLQRCLT